MSARDPRRGDGRAGAAEARDWAMERTVRLYPWYAGVLGFWFWIPVFFLFFSQHLSLDRVLILEAIYYASVVLLELPSGYFSDRVGRRATLLISALAFVMSYALFVSGQGFVTFALAQFLLAAGYAFTSGTDTSLHYDALAASGRAGEYAAREARVARIGFLAGAVGAVAGGAAGSVDLRLPYAFSLVSSLVLVGIVLAMREPRSEAEPERARESDPASEPDLRSEDEAGGSHGTAPARPVPSPLAATSFRTQMRIILRLARQPELGWLFAFALWMTVLIHIPYEFYQPYLDVLAEQVRGDAGAAGLTALASGRLAGLPVPLASGLVMAISMLVGAWFAGRSIRVRDRLGTAPTLLAGLGFVVLVTAAMGRFLAPWVVILILLRNLGRGLMTAPLNAAVTPRLPRGQRATYLSLQSLAGRLSFSLVLLGLSGVAGAGAHPGWTELSRLLTLGAGLGALAWLVLVATARRLELDAPEEGGA